MSHSSYKTPRVLLQHDWDFSECPLDELPSCCRYEYGRESDMKKVVLLFRKQRQKFQFDNAATLFFSVLMFDFFADVDGFPECPWLDLPRDVRSKYCQRIVNVTAEANGVRGLRFVTGVGLGKYEWPTWHECRRSLHPDAIQGWFEIPAGFSKKEIVKQFKRHLETFSIEKPTLFSENSGGRGGPEDKLNRLGAYRIMCGRTVGKSINFVAGKKNSQGQVLHLYDEDNDNPWIRARRAAAREIKLFNDLACDFLSAFQQ